MLSARHSTLFVTRRTLASDQETIGKGTWQCGLVHYVRALLCCAAFFCAEMSVKVLRFDGVENRPGCAETGVAACARREPGNRPSGAMKARAMTFRPQGEILRTAAARQGFSALRVSK